MKGGLYSCLSGVVRHVMDWILAMAEWSVFLCEITNLPGDEIDAAGPFWDGSRPRRNADSLLHNRLLRIEAYPTSSRLDGMSVANSTYCSCLNLRERLRAWTLFILRPSLETMTITKTDGAGREHFSPISEVR